ncbi:MAG: hypothetical protein K2M83_13635 [Muribaculaceae bacterium]|nr:hypothetical protein [Muribaculaceae bacterium]
MKLAWGELACMNLFRLKDRYRRFEFHVFKKRFEGLQRLINGIVDHVELIILCCVLFLMGFCTQDTPSEEYEKLNLQWEFSASAISPAIPSLLLSQEITKDYSMG